MNTQPGALRLADELVSEFVEGCISNNNGLKAAAELRRLHEVNQALVEAGGLALEALNSFELYDGNELWSSSVDASDIDSAVTKLRLVLYKAKEQT
jgi:G3E family GTPase